MDQKQTVSQEKPTAAGADANPLALVTGEGYDKRLQAVLAAMAQQPGVIDHVVTCAKCGAHGRPRWSYIGAPCPYTMPPLPLAWSTHNGRAAGDIICNDCVSAAIEGALASIRRYLATPAGQMQLEREALGEECEA